MRRALDMLLVLDLTTHQLVQERGSVSVRSDGSVAGEITVYHAEGRCVPSFSGAENLIMVKRSEG